MEIKKILVIRFRRVGDAVISSTLCTSLKKSFPNAEIHYVLNEGITPLFEHHPDIDTLISFSNAENDNLLVYLKKINKIVHENKYDIIVDTRSTIRTLFFSLLSLKTPYRIGRKKWYNKWIHNMRTNNDFDGISDNVQMTLALLNPLAVNYTIVKDPIFKLYYLEQEKNSFKNYMIENGIDFNKPIIVCAVTARLEHKVWAKEKMKVILEQIMLKYEDAQLIFNYGGAVEKEFALKFHQEISNPSHVFTNIEAKNLRQLIALLANADFFFGNEGGPRHISQALNVPSFAIYPPKADKNNWLPNQSDRFEGIELADIDPVKATNKELSFEKKLALIDEESVWNGLNKMLAIYLKK